MLCSLCCVADPEYALSQHSVGYTVCRNTLPGVRSGAGRKGAGMEWITFSVKDIEDECSEPRSRSEWNLSPAPHRSRRTLLVCILFHDEHACFCDRCSEVLWFDRYRKFNQQLVLASGVALAYLHPRIHLNVLGAPSGALSLQIPRLCSTHRECG